MSAQTPPKGWRFPNAFTILIVLIIAVAALTWVIPSGQYTRVPSEALGKDVPVAGTYALTPGNPQGFVDVILAPIAGFYDPDSYAANAIDVALFVLIIGGFIGVVTATGAIDAGIRRAMLRLKGREMWMIPILMALFALGGTTYGMAEETLAFYGLLIPVMIAAGYDALVAVAVPVLVLRWQLHHDPRRDGPPAEVLDIRLSQPLQSPDPLLRLSQERVLFKHIFRNALIPLITGFPAAFIGAFFAGSLLIETLFSLDGLGLLSYESVIRRDYPVVLGTLFFFTLIGLITKLISDLCYVWVDPRVKFD